MSSCFLRLCFFQPFPFPFPLLKFVSFYLASFFLESKPKAFQRISFSQAKKTWMIMIHNSMVCLRVHYCVQLLPEVVFFETFSLPFPLLKFVSFYLASFFLESKPKAFQRISFSQAKKHEWSWYTIVWFVWGYTIVSSCFLRWFCFLTVPLHFPLLKLFYFLNEFLLFRILRNAQFPKIYDALLKPN